MDRRLKLMNWNANGVATRRHELHLFAVDNDLDVLLLSETRLQPNHVFNIPGYQTYRTDRPARGRRNPGGGTAILVHRRVVHRLIQVNTNVLESTGIAVHAGGAELCLFAAYSPPRAAVPPAELDALLGSGRTVIIGGDLNAKHASWHSRNSNTKGQRLRSYIDQRDDTVVAAPLEPTLYPPRLNALPDVIDVFLLKDLMYQYDMYVTDDLSSDHVPVIFEISTTPASREPPRGLQVRTDWGLYGHLLVEQLTVPPPANTTNELDMFVSEMQTTLSEALVAASRPAPPRNTRSALPPNLRAAIGKRRRLRRIWQRTRHPATKRAFNHQCDLVKRLLFDYRNESWNTYLSGLDLENGSAWRTAKILRSEKPTHQPLHGQQGMVYRSTEKAEVFSDTMEDQFRPNADIFNEDHIEHVENFLENFFVADPEPELEPFTFDEVEAYVSKSKPRKAPGLDGVGSRALLAAPAILIACFVSLFNSAMSLHHFPASWKIAKVILIPKPGKSRLFPQNFRPISLLPAISKIFERLLLSRIWPYLDGYIRPEQFGFRKDHSTTQQLVRVVNKLVDNANLNLCSVAVLLDVSKAFDKVWHQGLLYKLAESPVPPCVVHLLRSYLTGRSFRVCVDGELSTERPIEAGVPQGSVLGPVLYLVYTNDMPTVPGVTLSLYADDAMFLCRSMRPSRAADVMQLQMDHLSPWLEKWRIAINADKSTAVCFRKRRRMPTTLPTQVTLDGVPITWKQECKYLGVTLDSRLNFGAHAKRKVDEAKRITGCLGPLIGRRSNLSMGVKTTMFMLIVRSVIMYASTAWWANCSKTNRKNLEIIQNKALRSIARQPYFVSNATIRMSLQVPTLAEFAKSTATKFFKKAAESTLPHIADIAARHLGPADYRRRPLSILEDPP